MFDRSRYCYEQGNGKITGHRDVMETIADQSSWQNENGKF